MMHFSLQSALSPTSLCKEVAQTMDGKWRHRHRQLFAKRVRQNTVSSCLPGYFQEKGRFCAGELVPSCLWAMRMGGLRSGSCSAHSLMLC